jgi:hypothetical protein
MRNLKLEDSPQALTTDNFLRKTDIEFVVAVKTGKRLAAPTDAPAQPLPELASVLEAHAPHEPIHSWKGFLIHIASIAIGLLLALGLEQTVEALHHAHQRSDLEQQASCLA